MQTNYVLSKYSILEQKRFKMWDWDLGKTIDVSDGRLGQYRDSSSAEAEFGMTGLVKVSNANCIYIPIPQPLCSKPQ